MIKFDIKSSSWSNISEKQLIKLAKLFNEQPSENVFRLKAFMILADIKVMRKRTIADKDGYWRWFKPRKGKKLLLNMGEIDSIIKSYDWLTEGIQLTTNIKKIGRYVGPDKKIYTLTLQQYLTADNWYNAYSSTRKVEYLNKFIGTIYLKNGESFNENKDYSKRFKHKDLAKKTAVYMWFTGVKDFLRGKYPLLFPGGSSDEQPDPADIFLNTLSSLNGGDITKNKQLLVSPVHEAFKQLENSLEHIENLKDV